MRDTTMEKIAHNLQVKFAEMNNPWENSPYKVFREHKSKKAGMIGEKAVMEYFAAKSFAVSGRKKPAIEGHRASDYDFLIEGKRIECKMSTRWESGMFRFQQIRDQEYDFLLFFGVDPDKLYLWVIPKQVAWANAYGQHGGKGARETKLIDLADPSAPPEWMKPYGGELTDEVLDKVRKILK